MYFTWVQHGVKPSRKHSHTFPGDGRTAPTIKTSSPLLTSPRPCHCLLSHLCCWAPSRAPLLPESAMGHLGQSMWGHFSDELTAALQTCRLHTQHGIHLTVLPTRYFMEHCVLQISSGCWSVAAKLSQTLVLGLFVSLVCNQQSAITLILTNHARLLALPPCSLSLFNLHKCPVFFPLPLVSRAVFQQAGCD